MKTDALIVFEIYRAIQEHFRSNYNAIKYNFKVKGINVDTFKNSKNVEKLCYYISGRYTNLNDLKMYIIANIANDNDIDIVKLCKDKEYCDKIYIEYRKKQESLGYIFREDLSHLFSSTQNIVNIYKCIDTGGCYGNYPEILIELNEGIINNETVIILNRIINFNYGGSRLRLFDYWDKLLDDDWKKKRKFLEKCSSFVIFDEQRMKEIMKECIKQI